MSDRRRPRRGHPNAGGDDDAPAQSGTVETPAGDVDADAPGRSLVDPDHDAVEPNEPA